MYHDKINNMIFYYICKLMQMVHSDILIPWKRNITGLIILFSRPVIRNSYI